MLHLLGIDHERLTYKFQGRHYRLTDVHGQVVKPLLAWPSLDASALVRESYRMKATTMTLSSKRQSVFPQDWCERVGLAQGGPVNAFDLGEQGLLIRPVTPPTKAEVARLLKQVPAGRHSPGEATEVVGRALRKVRRK